ncbi:MAG: hypothetical protein AAF651_05010 [Cyanobacteria bacterium P01_C01_bin.73]
MTQIPNSILHPNQIVYLELGNERLYAEVIEVVVSRQLCWARPLLLRKTAENDRRSISANLLNLENAYAVDHAVELDHSSGLASPELYNLKEGPDLIWPIHLFNPAFDIDLIDIMPGLDRESSIETLSAARQKMNHFIQQFWKAYSLLKLD